MLLNDYYISEATHKKNSTGNVKKENIDGVL